MKRLFQKGEPHDFALHITTVHNFPSGYPYVKIALRKGSREAQSGVLRPTPSTAASGSGAQRGGQRLLVRETLNLSATMYPEGKASGEYNSKIFEVHLLVPEGDLSDPDAPFRRSIGSGSLDVAPYVSMERRPIPATVKLNVAMANGKEAVCPMSLTIEVRQAPTGRSSRSQSFIIGGGPAGAAATATAAAAAKPSTATSPGTTSATTAPDAGPSTPDPTSGSMAGQAAAAAARGPAVERGSLGLGPREKQRSSRRALSSDMQTLPVSPVSPVSEGVSGSSTTTPEQMTRNKSRAKGRSRGRGELGGLGVEEGQESSLTPVATPATLVQQGQGPGDSAGAGAGQGPSPGSALSGTRAPMRWAVGSPVKVGEEQEGPMQPESAGAGAAASKAASEAEAGPSAAAVPVAPLGGRAARAASRRRGERSIGRQTSLESSDTAAETLGQGTRRSKGCSREDAAALAEPFDTLQRAEAGDLAPDARLGAQVGMASAGDRTAVLETQPAVPAVPLQGAAGTEPAAALSPRTQQKSGSSLFSKAAQFPTLLFLGKNRSPGASPEAPSKAAVRAGPGAAAAAQPAPVPATVVQVEGGPGGAGSRRRGGSKSSEALGQAAAPSASPPDLATPAKARDAPDTSSFEFEPGPSTWPSATPRPQQAGGAASPAFGGTIGAVSDPGGRRTPLSGMGGQGGAAGAALDDSSLYGTPTSQLPVSSYPQTDASGAGGSDAGGRRAGAVKSLLGSATPEVLELQSHLEAERSLVVALRSELRGLRGEQEAAQERDRRRLDDLSLRYREASADAEALRAQLKESLAALEAAQASLQGEREARGSLAEAHSEALASGAKAADLVEELRETLRLTTQERDEAMSISEELEAELAKMRGEDGPGRRWREEAEEKIASLQRSLEDALDGSRDAESRAAAAAREAQEAQVSLATLQEENRGLKRMMGELEVRVERFHSGRKEEVEEWERLRASLEFAEAELEAARAELQKEREARQAADIAAGTDHERTGHLERLAAAAESKSERLAQDLGRAMESLHLAESAAALREGELRSLRAEVEARDEDLLNHREEIQNLSDRVDQLLAAEAQLAALQGIEAQCQATVAELHATRMEARGYRTALQDLEHRYQGLMAEYCALQEERTADLQRGSEELEALRTELVALRAAAKAGSAAAPPAAPIPAPHGQAKPEMRDAAVGTDTDTEGTFLGPSGVGLGVPSDTVSDRSSLGLKVHWAPGLGRDSINAPLEEGLVQEPQEPPGPPGPEEEGGAEDGAQGGESESCNRLATGHTVLAYGLTEAQAHAAEMAASSVGSVHGHQLTDPGALSDLDDARGTQGSHGWAGSFATPSWEGSPSSGAAPEAPGAVFFGTALGEADRGDESRFRGLGPDPEEAEGLDSPDFRNVVHASTIPSSVAATVASTATGARGARTGNNLGFGGPFWPMDSVEGSFRGSDNGLTGLLSGSLGAASGSGALDMGLGQSLSRIGHVQGLVSGESFEGEGSESGNEASDTDSPGAAFARQRAAEAASALLRVEAMEKESRALREEMDRSKRAADERACTVAALQKELAAMEERHEHAIAELKLQLKSAREALASAPSDSPRRGGRGSLERSESQSRARSLTPLPRSLTPSNIHFDMAAFEELKEAWEVAEAAEDRAASAEVDNQSLREQLANVRAELDELKRKAAAAEIEAALHRESSKGSKKTSRAGRRSQATSAAPSAPASPSNSLVKAKKDPFGQASSASGSVFQGLGDAPSFKPWGPVQDPAAASSTSLESIPLGPGPSRSGTGIGIPAPSPSPSTEAQPQPVPPAVASALEASGSPPNMEGPAVTPTAPPAPEHRPVSSVVESLQREVWTLRRALDQLAPLTGSLSVRAAQEVLQPHAFGAAEDRRDAGTPTLHSQEGAGAGAGYADQPVVMGTLTGLVGLRQEGGDGGAADAGAPSGSLFQSTTPLPTRRLEFASTTPDEGAGMGGLGGSDSGSAAQELHYDFFGPSRFFRGAEQGAEAGAAMGRAAVSVSPMSEGEGEAPITPAAIVPSSHETTAVAAAESGSPQDQDQANPFGPFDSLPAAASPTPTLSGPSASPDPSSGGGMMGLGAFSASPRASNEGSAAAVASTLRFALEQAHEDLDRTRQVLQEKEEENARWKKELEALRERAEEQARQVRQLQVFAATEPAAVEHKDNEGDRGLAPAPPVEAPQAAMPGEPAPAPPLPGASGADGPLNQAMMPGAASNGGPGSSSAFFAASPGATTPATGRAPTGLQSLVAALGSTAETRTNSFASAGGAARSGLATPFRGGSPGGSPPGFLFEDEVARAIGERAFLQESLRDTQEELGNAVEERGKLVVENRLLRIEIDTLKGRQREMEGILHQMAEQAARQAEVQRRSSRGGSSSGGFAGLLSAAVGGSSFSTRDLTKAQSSRK